MNIDYALSNISLAPHCPYIKIITFFHPQF